MKTRVKPSITLLPFCCLVAALTFANSRAVTWGAVDESPRFGQWQPLFNGKNLDGWYVVIGDKKSDDPNRLVQVHNGMVHMYKDASADSEQPFGYIATDKEYTDFDLRLEYQWGVKRFAPRAGSPRDSGILYCAVGKDGVWPRCVECQIWEGDVGDTYAVYTRVTAPVDPATKNQPVYLSPEAGGIPHIVGDANSIGRVGRNPMNEHEGWNTIEVVVRNGGATHIVNGRTVNEVTKIDELVDNTWVPLRKGRIALQLEGAEIFYRNIQIKTNSPAAEQQQVEQWGVFEVSLDGPKEGNPFLDVNLAAEFTNRDEKTNVTGFYDGEGKYVVRFMPAETGTYKYVTRSNVKALEGQKGEFECVKPSAKNHGPVHVKDTYHFAYADGTRYLPIGTTCYAWTHQGDELEELTLRTLRNSPFNKMRMCIFPKDYAYNDVEPRYYPFERNTAGKSDFTRFNPVFWRHFERRVGELRDLGIEADIILFHPYDYDRWGYDEMPPEADERYLRYAIARLAAYRNVWWSMANEALFMEKPADHWERSFRIVQESDPYQHLRSIHGPKGDAGQYPITHASTVPLDARSALEWRRTHRKPLIFDEVGYEGNAAGAWGDLTPQELTAHFWEGAMLGGYVGHSETHMHPQDILWWSKGGVLHGESPPRIAFLRKILEEGPAEGINPIDAPLSSPFRGGSLGSLAGKEGEFYLYYLGAHQPAELYLALPAGGPYTIEIIDTWQMTITEVPGQFMGVPKLEYLDKWWKWRGMVKLRLPGKPYVALRIKKVTNQ